jgi:hypothetical protein
LNEKNKLKFFKEKKKTSYFIRAGLSCRPDSFEVAAREIMDVLGYWTYEEGLRYYVPYQFSFGDDGSIGRPFIAPSKHIHPEVQPIQAPVKILARSAERTGRKGSGHRESPNDFGSKLSAVAEATLGASSPLPSPIFHPAPVSSTKKDTYRSSRNRGGERGGVEVSSARSAGAGNSGSGKGAKVEPKKGKSGKRDPETDFLDSLLAEQNKTGVQFKRSSSKSPPLLAPTENSRKSSVASQASQAEKKRLNLKDMVRQRNEEKKNAARFVVQKKPNRPVIHMDVVDSPKQGLMTVERVGQDGRVQGIQGGRINEGSAATLFTTRQQGTPGTSIKTETVDGDDRKSSEINYQITSICIELFEAKVARGEMTMEDAMALAIQEWLRREEAKEKANTSVQDGVSQEGSESSGSSVYLDRYQKLKSEKPELLKAAVDEVLASTYMDPTMGLDELKAFRERERKTNFPELKRQTWITMCTNFYKHYSDKVIIQNTTPITNPVRFYEHVLRDFLAQSMSHFLSDMEKARVFTKYPPGKMPLVLIAYQEDGHDIFPKLRIPITFERMVEAGFVPPNPELFNPYGKPVLAYALFWSLSENFSLFGSFFAPNEGQNGHNYTWVAFDRSEDITTILRRPAAVVRAPLTMTPGRTVNFDGDGVASDVVMMEREEADNGDEGVMKGWSHDSSIMVSTEVLTPSFMASFAKDALAAIPKH